MMYTYTSQISISYICIMYIYIYVCMKIDIDRCCLGTGWLSGTFGSVPVARTSRSSHRPHLGSPGDPEPTKYMLPHSIMRYN